VLLLLLLLLLAELACDASRAAARSRFSCASVSLRLAAC